VRLEPNRGAFVAQPSQTEAREIFEMRILVEPRAAALAAARATPADANIALYWIRRDTICASTSPAWRPS
jgi:DNA-binding GntR family transcriptional regulator